MIRTPVKLLLEKHGFDVLEGVDGRQAIELTRRVRADLLIIDLLTPEMDGYEALVRIRRDVLLAMLPVIVMTAETGPGVEARVLELGADDYLVKHFDGDVLLSRVYGVFERAERIPA